jgi:hypothetical protein
MSESDEHFDPLPKMIADLDQALEMAGQVARMTRGHYEAFIEEGFNDKQALYLAIAYLRGPSEPPAA